MQVIYKFILNHRKAILAVLISILIPTQSAVGSIQNKKASKINFENPVSVNLLLEKIEAAGVKPTELFYKHKTIKAGFTVRSEQSIKESVDEFKHKHREFLDKAIEKRGEELNKAETSKERQRIKTLKDNLINSKDHFQDNPFQISGVRLKNIEQVEKLQQILDTPLTKDNKYSSSNNVKKTQEKQSFGEFNLASLYNEPWAPSSGESDVNQNYSDQTFYFNDVSDYGSSSTYEHETQVYDSDYANYDNYWSSNLPSAYYDTTFSDDSDLDNFTVGTSQASSLQTNTEYYTYMSLTAGSSSSATVRIKGQKGHRTPSYCHSTWCIFADATTGSMAMFTAPGGMSWQY